MKNKTDPALLRASYLPTEIKKNTQILWDYPFKWQIYKNWVIKSTANKSNFT
jgi:hypothetical protein